MRQWYHADLRAGLLYCLAFIENSGSAFILDKTQTGWYSLILCLSPMHLLNSNVQIDLVIFMYNCTCIYVFHTCMYLVSKFLLTCFNWKYNSIMFVYKTSFKVNNLELSLLFLFGERPCNSTQLLWSISGWLLTPLGNIHRFFFQK